jgi:uncharacterized protein YjgD (DUF1641 family)
MPDKALQEQINEINRKLDLLIDEVSIQRQNREAVNDLIDDVAVIGKDAFKQMVIQLDDAGIEMDSEALKCLVLKLIRNIDSLGMVLETLESFNDLAKDVTPIIKQIGLDGVQKFHELEQKGYFEILNQLILTIDTITSRYTLEDIRKISENLIPIADTFSILGNQKVLDKINAIFSTLRDIKVEEVQEISVWKLMRDIRKPSVKKSIGFMMAFLEVINEKNNSIQLNQLNNLNHK